MSTQLKNTKRDIWASMNEWKVGTGMEHTLGLLKEHPDVISVECIYTNIREPITEVRCHMVVPAIESARISVKHFHLSLCEKAATMSEALRRVVERWSVLDYEHMRAMHGEEHVCNNKEHKAQDIAALLQLLAAPEGPPS